MKDVQVSQTTAIRGARVILADDIVDTDVLIVDGLIQHIGDIPAANRTIDGRGLYLAAAMVDIHGDAFERQIMPRPNVVFPIDAAVLETDRQLAANGIATAYHALTLGWEPGLRSVENGRVFVDALTRLAPRLCVENRIQLRWETFAFEAVELIEEVLRAPLRPSLAFNDHLSMSVRDFDTPVQQRAFEQSPGFAVADLQDPRMIARITGNAKRAGLDTGDYMGLLTKVWERRDAVGETIQRVATTARTVAAPMLSHDDTQIETRDYFRALGAQISEFPMTLTVAEAARAAGDVLVFGAPNALRGGSHIGSLGAGDMVEAGLCDVLASDYSYPAMLAAVARLDAENRAPRPYLWSLVSSGPAHASGLGDRGDIAPGKRGDLVLIHWPERETPAVVHTLVAGRTAYFSEHRF